MEVRGLFGRFVWHGVNIDDITIHPSQGSRINSKLRQDSTTRDFRFNGDWKGTPSQGAGMDNVRRMGKATKRRKEMKR